ncbi:MAG: glycoside hydrolase family 172 protein [Dehalococcoidia bacterium]
MNPDPSHIDLSLDSRAITFENPTGARGAGGTAHGGRKGAPQRNVAPGESIELANIAGPGTIRHIWMTFPPAPPELMRALWMEVFYDGLGEPSISVPCLDFFAMPLGRPVDFHSAMASAQEGRGFNAYYPMPFRKSCRVVLTNSSSRAMSFYYQLDYTLQSGLPGDAGYLHVSFRRENPTVMKRDFVISDELHGPGRFLGCAIGIRTIDRADWYGEGEVKFYLDGDRDLPTICGTGLEDYVGSAWGMGAHFAHYAGSPLEVRDPEQRRGVPDFLSFYRWHIPDPVIFRESCRVTIQQIGFASFREGQEERFEEYNRTNPAAGAGWTMHPRPGVLASGIAERVDDYCATAFVYCTEPQGVPPLDVAAALAEIERKPYEGPSAMERAFAF